MIYLDNGATSWPKPESVYQTMDTFLREKGGNPGRGSHSLAAAATETIEETRMLMTRFINAPEKKRVIFTLNCTDALNMGLKGLLRPGDHVISSSIGHNSLIRPLKKLERQGIKTTYLHQAAGSGCVSAKEIEESITGSTKLVLVTHASNVTGIIQPIEEYGAVARKHGLIFMVDAAQTIGKYPIDVVAGNIDLLACSGHKGLFGPSGTGVLYVGDRCDLETVREGGTGSYSEQEEQPTVLPDRYESGTLNSVGISGLGAGIKYVLAEGLEKIHAHGQGLRARIIESLSQMPGIKLYGTEGTEGTKAVPVVSFNVEGYDAGEVGTILDQVFDIKVRTGLHCAPAAHKVIGTYPKGTVRLSAGYFNTEEDIDQALAAIKKIAAN
jgi:cysteine desulfurase family protein